MQKRSFLAVWALSVALSLSACFAAVIDFGIRTYRRVRDWGAKVVQASSPQVFAARLPLFARLSAAAAFMLRQAKRDRPVIQARWRMCASV